MEEIQRLVEVAKKNDKKAQIVNDTCGIIDPVLRRYAGQEVDGESGASGEATGSK